MIHEFANESADTESGVLEGSLYRIVLPSSLTELNGSVLLYCHGYRPIGIPLQATFRRPRLFAELLSQGWILATLSYRREGYILEDGMIDINNLRAYILQKFLSGCASPKVVIYSRSMGGAISTLLAERFPENYHSIFAVGAALLIDPIKERENSPSGTRRAIEFTHEPQTKIMYMMNSSELGWVLQYVSKIAPEHEELKENIVVRLANRPGHGLCTANEIRESFFELQRWADGESELAPLFQKDITDYSVPESEVEFLEPDVESNELLRGRGKVDRIDVTGHVYINFTEQDLRRLSIRAGNRFEVVVASGTFEFLLGNYPFVGIETGALVAATTSWKTALKTHSIKTVKDHIASILGVHVGDEVLVKDRGAPARRTRRRAPVDGGIVAQMLRKRETETEGIV